MKVLLSSDSLKVFKTTISAGTLSSFFSSIISPIFNLEELFLILCNPGINFLFLLFLIYCIVVTFVEFVFKSCIRRLTSSINSFNNETMTTTQRGDT